jgi:hypothetical protein
MEIIGEVLCLIAEVLAGPICGVLFPNRVTRVGLLAWWAFTFAMMWLVLDWWGADPASDLRAYLVSLCCVGMPGLGLYRALILRNMPPAPPSLPRTEAGLRPPRNDRLRVS